MPRGARRLLSPALLLLVASVAAACAGAGGSPAPSGSPEASPATAPGSVGHATGAKDIVLRVEQAGGFTPPEFQFARVPEFTLYGDGTVLYQLPFDPNDPAPVGPPRLARATLTAEQMDALLAYAINAGGLGAAKPQYVNPLVADAPDTIFTIATDEVSKVVTAQALAMVSDPNNPDATNPDLPAMKTLLGLYESLVPFGGQIERGNASDAGFYEPTAYRAVIQEGAAQGEMIDWPWPDLTLDSFVADPDSMFRMATITPAQAQALSPEPQGGLYGVTVMGPDRVPYRITLRPLLPEDAS